MWHRIPWNHPWSTSETDCVKNQAENNYVLKNKGTRVYFKRSNTLFTINLREKSMKVVYLS